MIPVNISKPQDLAIIFAIFALVVVTVGFGITSIQETESITVNDTFYTSVSGRVTDSDGLKSTADTISEGLIGQEGASNTDSEDNILVQGFNSLLSLGRTFTAMEESLDEGTGVLGIDPLYLLIFTSILLISFGVVMYTWIRGR